MTLLDQLVSYGAEATPHAAAIIEPRDAITYAELERKVNRVAKALLGAGIARGDRVILALENSIVFVAAYFGIMRAGAVAVPLAPGMKNDRLQTAVADCTPVGYIVDNATLGAVARSDAWQRRRLALVLDRSAIGPPPPGVTSLTEVLDSPECDGSPPPRSETDLAAIIYTSGSTGEPRGVMLSHVNFVANARSIVQYLGLTAADRVMVVLPFYYVYGLSLLHTHLAVRGSLVLDNRFAFPNVVLNTMQEHGVTGFAGVPSTFAILLHRSKLAEARLPALRYVTQAGGPMPPARLQEWLAVLPDVPFFVMYGATEAAARLAYLHPSELPRRLGSIGRAIPNVELCVRRDDGQRAAPGEVGEIVARGPNISPGYWNCPNETHDRFGPDGFRTGDLGFADEEGFFYLVGRRHDMIKVGAHRVGAKEIEDVLHEHPAVHEAAVIAEPHPLLGEAPAAHVAVRTGITVSDVELIVFCRARLPEHKVPATVSFHRELPKTNVGKIAKSMLKTATSATGDLPQEGHDMADRVAASPFRLL